jgi:multidrug efflux pump
LFLPEVCIRRPVLATVMSVGLILFGIVGYSRLAVREIPDIELPTVSIVTVMPGASPEVVETEVTEILEEELNGVDGVDIMESSSHEEVSRIRITFDLDRNIDAAAQDVRDRVARAARRLPEDAEDPSVTKLDINAQAIMWIALFSNTRSVFDLINVSTNMIVPRLETVPGVGRVQSGGSNSLAMRVELEQELLAAHGVTITDVVRALQTQNVEVPGGRVEGKWREFVVKTQGEFDSPEGFSGLIVAFRNDSPVRLGDVATVRHGFSNERTTANFNGVRTIGMGIIKITDANTLDVANGVKATLAEVQRQLPPGYTLQIAFDQSTFIEQSIREVQQSLLLAGILVVIVIFVFLQSARSTLIPSVTIPVAIISTFGVIYFLGFTINNLVLMALTLVVGVVVDDAIIVLENIYRHMEEGAPRREAAFEASSEIAFAVVSTTLTLVAVFVPIAFLGGMTGRFFYEFGISVIVAVSVSSFVALTLTPMLCSRFLSLGTTAERNHVFGRVARSFDTGLAWTAQAYSRLLAQALDHRGAMVMVLAAAVVASVVLFQNVGKEFLPQDDRGYFNVAVSTPEGSTLAYQYRYQTQVEHLLDDTDEIISYFSIVAAGRGGPGSVNSGFMFVRMSPKEQRARWAPEILSDLRRSSSQLAGADVYFFQFDPIRSRTSDRRQPVAFVLEHSDLGALATQSERLRQTLAGIDGFVDIDTNLELNKPQLNVTIQREKARSLGISVADVADTLKVLLGGDRVSSYKRGNERYDVMAQLQAGDRFTPRDLSEIYVRTNGDELVPLNHLVEVNESVGPSVVNHYNRRRSVILSASLEDLDLGEAITKLQDLSLKVLPEGFTTSLAGMSREHMRSSQGLGGTFLLALFAIYLVLAAQFESFVHPFTIMLALPLAAFGALAGLSLFGMTLSVYSYIGLIMLMGLVTKNSILLVDYINILRERGIETREAIVTAGRTRLRPILMTAVSTVFGILPIALALGAGSEGRRPLGIVVITGMVTSTLLTLVVVPVVYSMIDDAGKKLTQRRSTAPAVADSVSEN